LDFISGDDEGQMRVVIMQVMLRKEASRARKILTAM
jgi:hypothetical protein